MHPSPTTLAQYLIGSLPEPEAESVEQHLDVCPDCEATIESLAAEDDTFVAQIRAGIPRDVFAEETGCRVLLEQLRERGPEPSVATPGNEPSSAGQPNELPIECVREYRLLERIGQGGMGTVYKAVHTKLGKVVALKLLPAHRMRDAAAVVRFEREMLAVGKLEHPNIVRATDAGEFSGMHYLVMELVEGADLGRLSNRLGPLGIAEACEVIRQSAQGLQHAYERGLVHRDIKPSNLMLAVPPRDSRGSKAAANDPVVKILDMGLALIEESAIESAEDLTGSGNLMGTIDYMAPEQAVDTHGVDIRADIYSLGATLYKLLTGRAPFAGPSFDTSFKKLAALAEGKPKPIGELRPDLPEPLANIVHRMLASNPADRPATPAEIVELLAPFAAQPDLASLLASAEAGPTSGAALEAPRTSQVQLVPAAQSEQRRPKHRLVFAVAISLLASLGAAALWFAFERWSAPAVTSIAQPDAATRSDLPSVPSNALDNMPKSDGHVGHRADRAATEWTLAVGGHVSLGLPNHGWADLRPGQKLPPGDFQILILSLEDKSIADADLARLDGLTELTVLALGRSPIGDQAIAQMGALPKLQQLYLSRTKISDAGVRMLVERYPTIDVLHLGKTQVTDDGVRALAALSSLRSLRLENPGVTDASIDTLAGLKHLRIVWLHGSKVTEVGLARLRATLPGCRIESDYGNFGPPVTPQ